MAFAQVSDPLRRTGHYLETKVKMDQNGFQLFDHLAVASKFCFTCLDLLVKADCAHHGLLQIRPIDGDGQISIFDLKSFDIGQLVRKLFSIIRCDRVDCKFMPLSLLAVKTNRQKIKPQFIVYSLPLIPDQYWHDHIFNFPDFSSVLSKALV